MKTLNRERTSAFYREPDGYDSLRAEWRRLARDRERRRDLTAAHHLLYLILRGRDWQTAFAPITNPKKLENGGFFDWGAKRALRSLHSDRQSAALLEPFVRFLRDDALGTVRALVPADEWDENPLEREPYHD